MERELKDGRDNKTHPEARVSTSTRLSEEVIDGACCKANYTPGKITRTPAQTIPGGQEEQGPTWWWSQNNSTLCFWKIATAILCSPVKNSRKLCNPMKNPELYSLYSSSK
jgi:hypothetical protein